MVSFDVAKYLTAFFFMFVLTTFDVELRCCKNFGQLLFPPLRFTLFLTLERFQGVVELRDKYVIARTQSINNISKKTIS